mmetsp:Transcript_39522/g.125654  ORF Transcript_39522/g.125654 Transcript_39522/m.125654 type:complete len:236 (+) Transcript_39522:272-979(+)
MMAACRCCGRGCCSCSHYGGCCGCDCCKKGCSCTGCGSRCARSSCGWLCSKDCGCRGGRKRRPCACCLAPCARVWCSRSSQARCTCRRNSASASSSRVTAAPSFGPSGASKPKNLSSPRQSVSTAVTTLAHSSMCSSRACSRCTRSSAGLLPDDSAGRPWRGAESGASAPCQSATSAPLNSAAEARPPSTASPGEAFCCPGSHLAPDPPSWASAFKRSNGPVRGSGASLICFLKS